MPRSAEFLIKTPFDEFRNVFEIPFLLLIQHPYKKTLKNKQKLNKIKAK